MVGFRVNSTRVQDLVAQKFGYGCSEEGMHNLAVDGASLQRGFHSNILSIDNSELPTSEVWFPNSLDPEPRTASPILMGDSALLEDEMWPEFLSERSPRSLDDVNTRTMDVPGSPLSDRNQGTLHSMLSKTSENVAERLDEMDTAQRNLVTGNSVHLRTPHQCSSSSKTKAVHWPEVNLLEKELKRQRSGVEDPSSIAIKENSVSNTISAVQLAPVKFNPALPQDFQHNRENIFEGEFPLAIDFVRESQFQSQSLRLHGMELEESQAGGTSNASTCILEAASANGSENSSSDKSKDPASGDNAVSFQIPANFATARALNATDFLSDESLEKGRNSTANLVSSKGLVPVVYAKNGAAPKSHHVQLVERHTGFRMISSTGTSSDSALPRESRWAEELLLECALAISSENVVRTQHLMWVLNDLGCLTGDANQRLAAHGLKSLFCKLTGAGEAVGLNPTLGQVNAGPKTVHRALLKFHDVNPWHHMVYTVANSVMIDSFECEEIVHVIDIGVSQGTQWPTFIEALATRASGPPLLRLTVVKDDEGAGTPGVPQGPCSTEFTVQLERFAKLMGIKIELHTVVSSLQNLTRRKLGLKEGEALAICAQFRLHRLSEANGHGELDEFSLEPGTPVLSPRDKFLQFMHELQPKVVILSENDTNHLDSDFVTRFRPTVDYFWKFLDSTSYSFHGKQSQERQIIEYEAAMAMVNNVACEGSRRIERNESHRGWTQRMERARFVPLLPREEILENIRTLVRKYDTNWEFGTDLNCVVLLWKHQPVTFCSVWKPA